MKRLAPRRIAIVLSLTAAVTTAVWAADVLTQLGIPVKSAQDAVVSAIAQGYFGTGMGSKALKAAAPAARAQLATGAIAWAKAFTTSPEFAAAYAKIRAAQKPTEPKFVGTPEEEYNKKRAEQKAEAAKNETEMKAAMAKMTPEMRKAIEEGMKGAAEIQAKMDTPEMKKTMIDGITMDRTSKKEEYQRDMQRWTENYPENPRGLVIKRLQKFLADTKDVDFDAQLTTKNGQKYFVKPEYEDKSSEWKQAFRAGRETVTAARTAVQAWLTELQKAT